MQIDKDANDGQYNHTKQVISSANNRFHTWNMNVVYGTK